MSTISVEAIEDELYRAYPVPKPPRLSRPVEHRRGLPKVFAVPVRLFRGALIGLLLALLFDRAFGVVTPVPHIVMYALMSAWVWPYLRRLPTRTVVARSLACVVVSLPFTWWP